MINVEKTIISQYGESASITQLVRGIDHYLDPRADIDLFIEQVWNINTATTWGLDVWGKIVGIERYIEIPDTIPIPPGSETRTFYIPDEDYRSYILFKCATNITNCSAPSINNLLSNKFRDRGRAYVQDIGSMTMQYVFEFYLTYWEEALLEKRAIIPKTTGVFINVAIIPPSGVFGFFGSNFQPFNQAPFTSRSSGHLAPFRSEPFNIEVGPGLFDFSWNAPGRVWFFPDGSTSTEVRPTRTLATGGTVVLRSPQGWGGGYAMNDYDTDTDFLGDLSDLPPLTYSLSLGNCSNVTGDLSDLPPVTYYLRLANCILITGSMADLPPVTEGLSLDGCASLTGIIPVTVKASRLYLYGTAMSQTDIEQSLINVDSVATPIAPSGAIFSCAKAGMPTITDPTAIAAAASLRSKGWTVNINE